LFAAEQGGPYFGEKEDVLGELKRHGGGKKENDQEGALITKRGKKSRPLISKKSSAQSGARTMSASKKEKFGRTLEIKRLRN